MEFTKAQAAAIVRLVENGVLVRGRQSTLIENGVANRTAGFLLANGLATATDEGTLVPTSDAKRAAKRILKTMAAAAV